MNGGTLAQALRRGIDVCNLKDLVGKGESYRFNEISDAPKQKQL
jgi:hypothetical protein